MQNGPGVGSGQVGWAWAGLHSTENTLGNAACRCAAAKVRMFSIMELQTQQLKVVLLQLLLQLVL